MLSSKSNLACPSCDSLNIAYIAKYRSSSSVRFADTLSQCSNCSLVFANPLPSVSFLSTYNSSYFKTAHNIDIKSSSNYAMKYLRGKYPLIGFYGLLAPLAYIGGEKINAVTIVPENSSYIIISITWTISFLLLFKVSEYLMNE